MFNKKDVIVIAKALIEDSVTYIDSDRNPYYWCEYCGAELISYGKSQKDFEHKTDCPVLVAKDILTCN